MSFLRRDPTTGRWVVFSDTFGPINPARDLCPFCEGNETMTPPEIIAWRRQDSGPNQPGWSVRVIPNARPLLRIESPLERHADGMYDTVSGTGAHEIVIETPEHRPSLTQLPRDQVVRVLQAWAARVRDLKEDHRFRSIFIFKNQGVLAGAGLPGHAHSQIIALPVTPKVLKEILDGARSHYEAKERCVFCDVVREELEGGTRVVHATDRFVVIVPYASRHPFECWILPREHAPDFETTAGAPLEDLADLLVRLLAKLESVLPEPAYNLFLYSGPNRAAHPARWTTLAADFHWHIQVLPRVEQVAGFEVGSGFYANLVIPEAAAAALRLDR